MMIRLRLISSIFMAILLMCSVRADVTPTAKPTPPAGGTQSAQAQSTPPYQLQAGDVIEIRLFYNPELNEQVQIRPDGRVSLQLIGEVELASKTVSGAIAELREKYAKEVRTPEVTIQIKTYATQKVYVVGEVLRPGVITLPGPMTILDAVSEAGGVKLNGNTRLAILLRKGPDGLPQERKLTLFNHGQPSADAGMLLCPFDVVMVPETKISRIDRWVDQSIKQVVPFLMSAGFNYLISRQTGGGTSVPIF
jgi:polysaccharide biosynthesis/export protein